MWKSKSVIKLKKATSVIRNNHKYSKIKRVNKHAIEQFYKIFKLSRPFFIPTFKFLFISSIVYKYLLFIFHSIELLHKWIMGYLVELEKTSLGQNEWSYREGEDHLEIWANHVHEQINIWVQEGMIVLLSNYYKE